MTITLAMVDTSADVGPVLEMASQFADLTASHVEVIAAPQKRGGDRQVPAFLKGAHVPIRHLKGPQMLALVEAVAEDDVIATVVPAHPERSPRYPVGPVVYDLLKQTLKPVLVVPLDVALPSALRRVLVPLDGAEASSRAVLDQLLPLCAKPIELVVLHVFTASTMPTMLDRPTRDLEILGKEFLRHHLPHFHDIQLSPGPAGQRVCEVSSEQNSDLVVLSWSMETSPGRAPVVREVLSSTSLPVLLLPTLECDTLINAEDNP